MQNKRSRLTVGFFASAVLSVIVALISAGSAPAATGPHTVQLKQQTVQLKSAGHDTVQLATVQLKQQTVQLGRHNTVQLKAPTTVQL